MSSPCRFAPSTIIRSTSPAKKMRGGRSAKSTRSKLQRASGSRAQGDKLTRVYRKTAQRKQIHKIQSRHPLIRRCLQSTQTLPSRTAAQYQSGNGSLLQSHGTSSHRQYPDRHLRLLLRQDSPKGPRRRGGRSPHLSLADCSHFAVYALWALRTRAFIHSKSNSAVFTLAHLSDIQLSPMPRARRRELIGKRVLGYVNWHRGRKLVHRRDILDVLTRDIAERRPDHVAVTGDLVNLGLPGEFVLAAEWLRHLGPPERVTAIPGNHDAYVRL